jgi:hypothetical protein
MKFVGLITAIAGLASALPARADIILNGGFETPGFSTPPYYRYLIDGDSTTIPGWQVIDDFAGENPYLVNIGGYAAFVHSGSYALSLNIGSGIRTTFGVTGGTTYDLSFFGLTTAAAPTLRIDVAGFVHTITAPGGGTPYTQYHYQFTPAFSDPAATLQFMNIAAGADFKIWVLDDIQLMAVEAPAPGAAALLALGLLAMAGARTRRSSSD